MAGLGRDVTGGDIGAKGVAPSDQAGEVLSSNHGLGTPRYRYELGASTPEVLRRAEGIIPADEADRMLEDSQAIARRARDAFKEACEATDPDQGESSFLATKHKLEELWNYAHLRDRPFRDLLALLTSAIRTAELTDFEESKRDVLRQAFSDLPKMFLEDTLVEQHINRFAEHGIDEVISPIRQVNGKRIIVTIEEID